MTPLRITIPGRPSTAHRPRFSGMSRTGKPIMRTDEGFRKWKRKVRAAALAALEAYGEWPRHVLGPRGGKHPLRYAVSVLGFSRQGYDSDNLRGALDACEGPLWPNDRRCGPVSYDVVTGCPQPFVRMDVVPYDPRVGFMRVRFEWEEHSDE